MEIIIQIGDFKYHYRDEKDWTYDGHAESLSQVTNEALKIYKEYKEAPAGREDEGCQTHT